MMSMPCNHLPSPVLYSLKKTPPMAAVRQHQPELIDSRTPTAALLLHTRGNISEHVPSSLIFNTVSNSKPRKGSPQVPEAKRILPVTVTRGR